MLGLSTAIEKSATKRNVQRCACRQPIRWEFMYTGLRRFIEKLVDRRKVAFEWGKRRNLNDNDNEVPDRYGYETADACEWLIFKSLIATRSCSW
jgi:hypothetical protein